MNNSNSLYSNPQPSQQLQQIIKLKVQLTKQKSKLQGYKEMQNSYKRLSIKSQAMEKQLTHYHKIMDNFFERLKKLMNLLDIDYVSIFGTSRNDSSLNMGNMVRNLGGNERNLGNNERYVGMNERNLGNNERNLGNNDRNKLLNESEQKINDSISFINLNPPLNDNPSLMRRINKLNSLKSISREYLPSNSIQFTHQDAKFQLIQSRIKSLLNSNQQYKSTLQKYQQSSNHIQQNTKQQQVIVKRLQSSIRMRQKQIQQRDCQIAELLRKIQEMKDELKLQHDLVVRQEKQQEIIVRTYQQLEGKIIQLRNENSCEEKRLISRNHCHQLLQQLSVSDETYLKRYLMQQNVLKHSLSLMKNNSPIINRIDTLTFYNHSNNKHDCYSQSGKAHKINSRHNPGSRNKYEFVFE